MPRIPDATRERLGLNTNGATTHRSQSEAPNDSPSPQKDFRRERLALAVADLERVPQEILSRVMAALHISRPFLPDKNQEDQPAVEFRCSLVQAATICDILRAQDRKRGLNPSVIWMMRKESWTRVGPSAVFTTVRQGVRVIHHELFADAVVKAPVALPSHEPLKAKGTRGRR